ncbi:MAG: ankyrin repeat domain-containing protein, partial [Gammaproteobacteria bacterium]|nr:ankyrin repeat domain-containing protein [Gammaproteobacteria bacterium]
IDHQDADGITALMEAASVRSESLVYLLLRNGADPRIRDKQGRDATDIAKKRRNKSVISLLEEAGN